MKIIYSLLILVFTFCVKNSSAQADNCSSATLIGTTVNCISPTSGTTIGATQNLPGCVGNADDDVWYQFVATSTSHQVVVVPSASMDPVVQLFSGGCSVLATISCMDAGLTAQTETINATGLTIGNTYRIRVYHFGTGSGSGTFTICVTNPPPAPSNDNCAGATNLNINATCINTAATTVGATQSLVGCAGNADDDVWFSFTATNTTATITVNPSSSMDAVVEFYSGTCGTLNSVQCEDVGFTNGNEVINALGLIPGNTYFIRVYDFFGGGGFPFDICLTGPGASAIPTNDEPCSAIALPAVTSDCNFLQFSTIGATASMGAPTPSACVGGSAPQQGGFTAGSHDVWFSVVAPANGQITITMQPNFGINDDVLVFYSGTCGTLSQIACSDDNNYPGAANDFKPYISQTGLTPGATYFIRYFGFGTNAGDFGFCVSSPINDFCSTALYICDLNGYSASTSAAYTTDRPCNMYGNNEDIVTGVDQPNGINTGGVFGQAGSWGTGAPFFDVNINNNSWIKFTASNTVAILNVAIGSCWIGNYPSGGIQMQIFSATNCCNFTPVSNFEEGSSSFTITANSLTIGNDYYLMIDGFAGDICNYTITANSGVQFPDIVSLPSLCFGDTTTLYGPALASSYLWSPGGATTQNILVMPSTTTTYTLVVEGVCGGKQTLTKTITVNPNATINLTTAVGTDLQTVCDSTAISNVTYNIGGGGTGASVSGLPTGVTGSFSGNTFTISGTPTAVGTFNYSVTTTGTCLQVIAAGTIIVDALDNSAFSYTSGTYCLTGTNPVAVLGGTTTLGGTFTISPSSGTINANDGTINLSATGIGNYIITYNTTLAGNACPKASTFPVTITLAPNGAFTYDILQYCQDAVDPILAFGAGSSGGVFTSNANPSTDLSLSSTTGAITLATSVPGTYTVYNTISGGGCATAIDSAIVTVNPLPIINGTLSVCEGITTQLTGTTIADATTPWSSSNSSVATVDNNGLVTGLIAGTTIITYLNVNGCTKTVTVQVNPLPTALILGTTLICQGGSTTLVASGGTSYLWGNGATASTITVSPLADSTYAVTVSNGNGCIDTASIFVQVTNNPTAQITGNDTICLGENTILTASGGGTYLWNNGLSAPIINMSPIADTTYAVTVDLGGCVDSTSYNVIVDTLPSVAITGDTTICEGDFTALHAVGVGNYSWSNGTTLDSIVVSPNATNTYTLIITDVNLCTDSADITIQVNQTPTINIAGILSICDGISTTLTASGGTSYVWNTTDTTYAITVTPTSTTNYNVLGTDANGCIDSALVTVAVLTQPVADITGTSTICVGESVVLAASGGGTYTWNTLDTTAIITMNPSDTITYSVIVNAAGCLDSATFAVDVSPLPIITAFNDTTIILGQSASIYAQATGGYSWSPSEGLSCITCSNPIAKPNETTTYCVATSENNCVNTSCVTVYVDNICGELYVPNAFSPNGDGNNDCLKVYNNCLAKVLFRVYSRWGELIYETEDIEACWDGTDNGKLLNTGVYTYTVAAKLVNGEEAELKGNVTLFK